MTRHRRLAGALTAGLVTLSLAACVSGGPSPAPTMPTAAPTASAPADAGPAPRIDATCDDVLDSAALQAFVGEHVHPLALVPPADRLTPDRAALEQLGALTCRWTNGLEGSPLTGPHSDAQVVGLSILPDGLDAAVAYVDLYGIADPTYGDHVQGPRCVPVEGAAAGYCELMGVIGATWVELQVSGIVDGIDADDLVAEFRGLTDPMVAAVAAMTPRERWAPAMASAISGADCDELTPTDEISAATGITELRVGLQWDGPRVGQYPYAGDEVGALRCSLAMTTSESSVGQIGILPNGAWGYHRYVDAWIADGGAPVAIDGIADGDATVRCGDPAEECVVDLTVADEWVRVEVSRVPEVEPEFGPSIAYYESARAAIEEIAAIVAGRILAA